MPFTFHGVFPIQHRNPVVQKRKQNIRFATLSTAFTEYGRCSWYHLGKSLSEKFQWLFLNQNHYQEHSKEQLPLKKTSGNSVPEGKAPSRDEK